LKEPFRFEATLAQNGNPFALNRQGEATLRLQVPGRFLEALAANAGFLFASGSFLVTIEPMPSDDASDLPKS
jgi:hypothetical protein